MALPKSMDTFIHSVTSAAKVLADLGYKVEDTEIKDILLMKLDDASVRTSIMTAKEEPDLATIIHIFHPVSICTHFCNGGIQCFSLQAQDLFFSQYC